MCCLATTSQLGGESVLSRTEFVKQWLIQAFGRGGADSKAYSFEVMDVDARCRNGGCPVHL